MRTQTYPSQASDVAAERSVFGEDATVDLMDVLGMLRRRKWLIMLVTALGTVAAAVLGMVITLEAPSAVSVGLCLAHIACDKRPWLEGLNVEMDWPMSGKPILLYLDNAAEFKSEALRRGCEQHGIRLDYRPLGQPHYGVLGIFRPKTTKCSGGHAVRGLQRGITFLALHIASHNKSIT